MDGLRMSTFSASLHFWVYCSFKVTDQNFSDFYCFSGRYKETGTGSSQNKELEAQSL